MSDNVVSLQDLVTLGRLQDFLANCDNRYISVSNSPDFGLSISGHTISIVSGGSNKSVTVPDDDTTYTPASANPVMDGSVAVGISTKYAREDHVHPTDTSRASASDLTTHTTNTDIHVTANEKNAWNAKTSNVGTVTQINVGAGLTGGPITSSGTVKAKLLSETPLNTASALTTEDTTRVYPVLLDSNGNLATMVPWNFEVQSMGTSEANAGVSTVGRLITAAELKHQIMRSIVDIHWDDVEDFDEDDYVTTTTQLNGSYANMTSVEGNTGTSDIGRLISSAELRYQILRRFKLATWNDLQSIT